MPDFVGHYIDGPAIGRYGTVTGVNIAIGYTECGAADYIKVGNSAAALIPNKVSQVRTIVIAVEVLPELHQVIQGSRSRIRVGRIPDKNFINDQVDTFISVQGTDLAKDSGDVVCSLRYPSFAIVDILIYLHVHLHAVIRIG